MYTTPRVSSLKWRTRMEATPVRHAAQATATAQATKAAVDEQTARFTKAIMSATGSEAVDGRMDTIHDNFYVCKFTNFGEVLNTSVLEGLMANPRANLRAIRLHFPQSLTQTPMWLEFEVWRSTVSESMRRDMVTPYVYTKHMDKLSFDVVTPGLTASERTYLTAIILYVQNMKIDMPTLGVDAHILGPHGIVLRISNMPTVSFDFVATFRRDIDAELAKRPRFRASSGSYLSMHSIVFEANNEANNEMQIELRRITSASVAVAKPVAASINHTQDDTLRYTSKRMHPAPQHDDSDDERASDASDDEATTPDQRAVKRTRLDEKPFPTMRTGEDFAVAQPRKGFLSGLTRLFTG